MINHTNSEVATGKRRRARRLKGLGVALTASALLVMSALPAWAAENMTITFIRHGQSTANAENRIDTQVPGPVLTADGQQQAKDIAAKLGDRNFDAIYASDMVRTQLTATPMSQYLGLPIQVLPGVHEIEAGMFENGQERGAAGLGYISYPLAWAGLKINVDPVTHAVSYGYLDPANPNYTDPSRAIPGGAAQPVSLNGNDFDARVNASLEQIYNNGDRNAAVFAHGGTIMFWTLMNAKNLSPEQKLNLFATAPLGNTGVVVVEGNPTDGYNLVEWNGIKIAGMQKGPIENVLTQVRTLSRQLGGVVQDVAAAFKTGDVGQILNAINRGAADALFSTTKFVRAINAQVIGGVTNAIDNLKERLTPPAAPAPAGAQTTGSTSGAAVSPAAFKAPAPVAAKTAAAAAAGDSPAKVADVPASTNKADEPKADADATKADDGKADADAAKADGQAKADAAKAKADAKKAAAEEKKAAAKAKADAKKAAAEEKKAAAKAKAEEKKAAAEAKKAEAKAKAESAKAGAGAGSTD
ncbi:histidine phosphatase family protein [Mycobacterium sp. PDNC021]|uniref:histidine phosphatase family protein n=1 Tax=Mycobacterium sp. PDNC021 TaxID=3391399 RepID=UPI003AACBA5C